MLFDNPRQSTIELENYIYVFYRVPKRLNCRLGFNSLELRGYPFQTLEVGNDQTKIKNKNGTCSMTMDTNWYDGNGELVK